MELEKDMGSRMGNPESDRRVYFCAFPSVALYLVPFNIRTVHDRRNITGCDYAGKSYFDYF